MADMHNDAARAFNDLVEINKTGAKGYQEAAEGVQNPQLKSELSRLSQQRAQFASELEQQARQLAERRSMIEAERDEFRRRGYDNPYGGFSNEQVLANVLGGMLGGILQGAVLRDVLNQGYQQRRGPWDSDFGGGGPFQFPFPGGGGGGGFTTGGGFGGGGGEFRTGGGF